MTKALTAKGLENFKHEAKRVEIPDGAMPGLYHVMQALPSQARSWAVRYRFNGVPRKDTLGTYPSIDLVTARRQAAAKLREIAEGRDPGVEKKAARRQAVERKDDAIEAMAELFIERHAKRNTRESSWRETARILGFVPDPENPAKLLRTNSNVAVLTKWKGRSIHDIGRRDVIALLDDIIDSGRPVQANRTLAAVRKMFSWAASRDIISVSPCVGVKPPAIETSRDRVLSPRPELRAVWQACDRVGYPWGPMTQMIIATAARRDEVAEMRWSEVDLETRTWTLARERVKNAKGHVVGLSDIAVKILGAIPRIKGDSDFVFTWSGHIPVTGFTGGKRQLDEAVEDILGEALPRWVFHDLRRSAATGMAQLGINLATIEKCLNHTGGSFAGVVGVYNRYDFAKETRVAFERWGQFIDDLMTDNTGNVIALRG